MAGRADVRDLMRDGKFSEAHALLAQMNESSSSTLWRRVACAFLSGAACGAEVADAQALAAAADAAGGSSKKVVALLMQVLAHAVAGRPGLALEHALGFAARTLCEPYDSLLPTLIGGCPHSPPCPPASF